MIGYLALSLTPYIRRVLRWVSASGSIQSLFDGEFLPMRFLNAFADTSQPQNLDELITATADEDVDDASNLGMASLLYLAYGHQPTGTATMVEELSEFVDAVDDLWDYFDENEVFIDADQTVSEADDIEENTIEFGGTVSRQDYAQFKVDLDGILPEKMPVATAHEPVVNALFLVSNLDVAGLEQ